MLLCYAFATCLICKVFSEACIEISNLLTKSFSTTFKIDPISLKIILKF
jgi:hypothetical protein